MSLLSRARILFNKLESYVATYTPLRMVMYDTISIQQKFNVFKRFRRSTTSFGG
jgi:hypothetical protein